MQTNQPKIYSAKCPCTMVACVMAIKVLTILNIIFVCFCWGVPLIYSAKPWQKLAKAGEFVPSLSVKLSGVRITSLKVPFFSLGINTLTRCFWLMSDAFCMLRKRWQCAWAGHWILTGQRNLADLKFAHDTMRTMQITQPLQRSHLNAQHVVIGSNKNAVN